MNATDHPELAALLTFMLRDPKPWTVAAVLADWLEEHGAGEQAAQVRTAQPRNTQEAWELISLFGARACPGCNGLAREMKFSLIDFTWREEDCIYCEGRGFVERVEFEFAQRSARCSTCPQCAGRGFYERLINSDGSPLVFEVSAENTQTLEIRRKICDCRAGQQLRKDMERWGCKTSH